MKRLPIILLLFTTLFMSACGKLPMNGRLDGMWQLMSIAPDGDEEINTKESKLYYNVQLHLIGLQKGGQVEYLGRFTQTHDSLFVHDFLLNADNSIQATPEGLAPFGIYGTSERFGIEEISNKKMVLKSNKALLTFRKF